MSSQKELAFDIKPVLGEINSIIQKEVQKILRKFLEKYSTYEETHNLVMNIPAVKKLRNAKEMFLATSGQRDDLSTTIQEFYRKIQTLTKENDSLKRELNKYKSEEHISLKISETDDAENAECDEKMYEKILEFTDSSSKKVLMNNMFKVTNEKEESDESDLEEESSCDEDEPSWKCDSCFYKNNMSEIKCEKCFSSHEAVDKNPSDALLVTDDEEEEEEEEEDEDDEEEEDEEESKKIDLDDDDEEDVFEIEIDDTDYFTNDETNGSIYKVDENGAPGKKIGHLKDGEPFFY
jgi:hypothetical protein